MILFTFVFILLYVFSCGVIAIHFLEGDIQQRDEIEAVKLFLQSAQQNYPLAEYNLGI